MQMNLEISVIGVHGTVRKMFTVNAPDGAQLDPSDFAVRYLAPFVEEIQNLYRDRKDHAPVV